MKRNYKNSIIFMISDEENKYIGGTIQKPNKRFDAMHRYNFNSPREFEVLKTLICSPDCKIDLLERVECENKADLNEKVSEWRKKHNVEYLDKKPKVNRPTGIKYDAVKQLKKNCVDINTEDTTIVWD